MAALAKSIGNPRRGIFRLLLATLAVCWLCHGLLALAADDASRLRGKYESLSQQLEHNPFRRPLYLESAETPTALKGDIYAVVDYPFATVNSALNDPVHGPGNWCDLLILHLNIKYCHASTSSSGSIVSVNIGRKVEQKLSDSYRVQFHYHASATSPGYF